MSGKKQYLGVSSLAVVLALAASPAAAQSVSGAAAADPATTVRIRVKTTGSRCISSRITFSPSWLRHRAMAPSAAPATQTILRRSRSPAMPGMGSSM